jgi:hypothetical protein
VKVIAFEEDKSTKNNMGLRTAAIYTICYRNSATQSPAIPAIMVKHSSGACCRGFLNANKDGLGPAKKTPGFLSGKDSALAFKKRWPATCCPIRKTGDHIAFKEDKDASQNRSCPGFSMRAGRLGPIGCLSTGLAGMMWAIWHILDQ